MKYPTHFDNSPMQYIAVVTAVKHDNFLVDFFIFTAQNDFFQMKKRLLFFYSCTKHRLRVLFRTVLTNNHSLYFRTELRK